MSRKPLAPKKIQNQEFKLKKLNFNLKLGTCINVITFLFQDKKKMESKPPAPKKKAPPASSSIASSNILLTDFGRKEARASTITKTAETAKRQKEREIRARKLLKKRQRMLMKKKREEGEMEMTQQELLEEAKLTEELNLASLKRYEQMELEAKRKANKLTKKSVVGPFIRYLSTTMPLIEVNILFLLSRFYLDYFLAFTMLLAQRTKYNMK